MKLFASILLILSLGPLAAATPQYTAYSVTNVQATSATDLGVISYTATVSTVKVPAKSTNSAVFPNGTSITIDTAACPHVPVPKGEDGVVLIGSKGGTLLFSGGGAKCKITDVTIKGAVRE